MVNINWQFQTMIPGGPAFTLNQPNIPVDGYDVVAVTVPAGKTVAVPIQPSSPSGDVVFLVVSSSQYDPKLTYTVDTLTVAHAVDGPHMLVGSGAVGLLNSAASPQLLTFDNTLANDVDVQVVVGRKIS
jgi:hypothetical protein